MNMAEFTELAQEVVNVDTVDDTNFLRLASRKNISSILAKLIKATKENVELKMNVEVMQTACQEAEAFMEEQMEMMEVFCQAWLDGDLHAQEEGVRLLREWKDKEVKF